LATLSLNGPAAFETIDQFDRAVVLDAQTLSHLPNRRSVAFRNTLDGQQKLMLRGLQIARPRLLFAEVEKSPDLVAEFR
jgi:hypothetical protein